MSFCFFRFSLLIKTINKKGDEDDELAFKKGDVLTITEQNGDWWQATLNGRSGQIPANYVKLKT